MKEVQASSGSIPDRDTCKAQSSNHLPNDGRWKRCPESWGAEPKRFWIAESKTRLALPKSPRTRPIALCIMFADPIARLRISEIAQKIARADHGKISRPSLPDSPACGFFNPATGNTDCAWLLERRNQRAIQADTNYSDCFSARRNFAQRNVRVTARP